MAEMVLLKGDVGLRTAIVLCPRCGGISWQVLSAPYDPSNMSFELTGSHICPICGTTSHTCTVRGQEDWADALARYQQNAAQYNQIVQTDYARRSEENFAGEAAAKAGADVDVQPEAASPFQTAPAAAVQDHSIDGELDRKIDRWKRELLDTGKKNKMINYRETSRATLKILEPEAAELFNRLAFSEKTLTFQKPISKDTDFRTYSMIALMETLSYNLKVQVGDIKTAGTIIEREKTLKNLRSKAKLAREEQGANILYLCFGFIYWRAQNKDSSPWLKAPLLLMPVTVGLKSLNDPYTISRDDDEIEVNPTLDYLFNTEYNIDLPKFDLKNRESFENYLAQIEEIVDKRGWKLVREVSLGLLSFLKISMYHDLNNNRERMVNHPVIRAMAGDRKALGDIPPAAEKCDFDAIDPAEWHEVVDADSSQEEAIQLSKLGVSFVMQGPPGTGKSQTITNIIAEALADGKKILFVSEKAAALEVVLRRLAEVRLDDFCLSLHNYKANKKEIIDSIGANLSLEPECTSRAELSELSELFHDRVFLTQYANDLHRVIEPLGESAYTVFGKLSKLEKASVVPFQFRDPASVTREQYSSLLYALDALEKALRNLGGRLDSNPWRGTIVKNSGQTFKQQMSRETAGLAEGLIELGNRVENFNSEYGTSIGLTWDAAGEGLGDVKAALKLPLFPIWWTDKAQQQALLSEVKGGAKTHRAFAPRMMKNREIFDDSVFDAPLDRWIESAKAVVKTFQKVGCEGDYVEKDGLSAALQAFDEVTLLLADLEEFTHQYADAANKLGLEKKDSLSNAKKVGVAFEFLKNRLAFCEKEWFQPEQNEAARAMAGLAEEKASAARRARDGINGGWAEQVRSIDLRDANRAFFEEYAWMFAQSDEEDMADRLAAHSCAARELRDRIFVLTGAFAKALQALGIVREDSLEGMRFVSKLLKQSAEAPLLEAVWFDVRKNNAAQPLLKDALGRFSKIAELTGNILQKWEPEALDMEEDALDMLGRFKTEYVGAFHRFKASYKEDIKRIRLLSKEVGKAIDEPAAISFLQALKELRDEKQWYVQNEDILKELAGAYYRGSGTDWEAVQKGMAVAAEIANSFPYANIPEKTIAAIQRASSSVQGTAELKELAAILSEERLSECEAMLDTANYIDPDISGISLGGRVVPQIERFLKTCAEQEQYIAVLQEHRLGQGRIVGREIRELMTNASLLAEAEEWFAENSPRLCALYGTKNRGAESDFGEIEKGILFAQEVTAFFEGNVPEAIVNMLCAEDAPDVAALTYDRLTPKAIDGLEQRMRSLSPYCLGEAQAVSDGALPKIRQWHEAAGSLAGLKEEIAPYLSGTETPLGQVIASLPDAVEVRDERGRILSEEAGLAQRLGCRYRGMDTDWASIERDIQEVKNFALSSGAAVSREFLEIICDSEEFRSEAQAAVDGMCAIREQASGAYQAFCGYFAESEALGSTGLLELSERYSACLDGFAELNKWLDYAEARAECDAKGLENFTAAIAERNNAVADVCNAFERGFYAQWLAAVMDGIPAVQSFRRRVHEQKLTRFVRLDTKQYQIAQRRIRERIIRSYPETNRVMKAGSELQILTHEMEKKSRIMPLRKLFQSIPELLMKLKPCLMMSPLSVAYFLEAGSYQFDMVIFDEASQIFPQDAIGAIFRAKQVIIAGDTRQLPPTNFFAASTSNAGEGYDSEVGCDDEVYDSILEETASVLPNRTLLWHYRSKHEHLIAFSNQEIYRNNLVTFPSSNESEPDTGVEFVYVQEGYYEPAPKNCNIPEAQRCVQLVKEHIEKHPDRSLGIIAFSEKQQQAIALEIQRFREKNPEYEDFFTEGRDDEFFVKNLENVQGDERDTIFFSVGYAKTKEQKDQGKPMSMRFGPLVMQGGERRLNVAITRAKINVKLVSSILPSDIDLNRTESEGVRMLRSYIEFAMNGEATLAAARKVSRPDDFANAIAQFIRDHGFVVRQHVGCSGYKIDIAVQHPSQLVEQFVAGIECDGFSYASAKTARDRERLRSSVLRSMGWNLYRVWSAEWQRNPEIEGQKLLDFIKRAIDECDMKVKALEEKKRRVEEAKRLEIEKARAAREAEERRKQREREEREAKRRAAVEEMARKRREEAERKAEQLKAEEERKAAEERDRRAKEERQRRNDLSWVRSGARVCHKNFGNGIIVRVNRDQVTVRFGLDERNFAYPSAFADGTISKPSAQGSASGPDQCPEWAKVGAEVRHEAFGIGTIAQIDESHVTVQFNEGNKRFMCPTAFVKGYLKRECPGAGIPDQILSDLAGAGFECIDNRKASSIVWVICSPEKSRAFEAIANQYKVKYSLERRGALATHNRPAWRVMAV